MMREMLSRKSGPGDLNQVGSGHGLWRTSSFCGPNGACVQFAELDGGVVGLRDSKDPNGPVLRFTAEEWRAFASGVTAGEFTV